MEELPPIQVEDGIFVVVADGWIKSMQLSMVDWTGTPRAYGHGGHPSVVMCHDAAEDLVAISPCGVDDSPALPNTTDWIAEVPHGMLTMRGTGFRKIVRVVYDLVAIVPRRALLAWPHPKVAPASLPKEHPAFWAGCRGMFNMLTKEIGVPAALKRFREYGSGTLVAHA